jgi:hypothetical protein
LDGEDEANLLRPADLIARYKNEIADAYGNGDFDRVPFILAFKRAAKGFPDGKPIQPKSVSTKSPGKTMAGKVAL